MTSNQICLTKNAIFLTVIKQTTTNQLENQLENNPGVFYVSQCSVYYEEY